MQFQPFILGRGMSGKAIAKALAVIDIIDPELEIAPPVQLERDQSLAGLVEGYENPILCVANPHGLHAQCVIDAEAAGLRDIIVDKPVCVKADDIERLRGVTADVAVLHGYRRMWGPQTIARMIADGEIGDVISIEGRYWQSSAAQMATSEDPPKDKSWKSDAALGGSYDTLVDLGTHWVDLMLALAGENPRSSRIWLSYANAPAANRDTHAHIYLEFPSFRAMGSVSKTSHGSGNDLELSVLGTERSVSWCGQQPDQIKIGRGNVETFRRRGPGRYGSQHPPFHGLGWLEGYIEIIHSFLTKKAGGDASPVPTLEDGLAVMEVVLGADRL